MKNSVCVSEVGGEVTLKEKKKFAFGIRGLKNRWRTLELNGAVHRSPS